MKEDTFKQAVKNRANERIQQRITNFFNSLSAALSEICEEYCTIDHTRGKELIVAALMPQQSRKWPLWIWTEEEARVQKELFELMDPIQRALMAKPPSENEEKPDLGPNQVIAFKEE